MARVLIVEDDPALGSTLEDTLQAANYLTVLATSIREGLQLLKVTAVDLMLLDIMLPDGSGLDMCKTVRGQYVNLPILILSAKSTETDKVSGLQVGADDYLTKPFSSAELLARMQAITRRAGFVDVFEFGTIRVDFQKNEVYKQQKMLKISAKEWSLLSFFIRNRGEILPREVLLREVWGYDALPSTRTVDAFVKLLRKKFEDNPRRPKHFVTIHTRGYKFVA